MRRLSNSLPLRFAAVSFVTLISIVAVIVMLANEYLRSQAVDVAIDHTVANLGSSLYTAITPSDLLGPLTEDRHEELDGFIRQSVNSELYPVVRVWSRDGALLYRTDKLDLGGASPPADDELTRALQGESLARVLDAGELAHGRQSFDADMIEIYVPLVFSGVEEPLGAFEIYQSYAPIAKGVAATRNLVFLAAIVGFGLIYATSVSLVWYISKTVRRQQAALASAYADLARARDKLETHVEERTADLSTAVASLRASEEAQRAMAEETAVLAEIGRTVNSSLRPDDVYELIAEQAHKLVHFDRIAVYLVDSGRETLTCSYIKGLDVTDRDRGTALEIGAFSGEVARRRSAVLVNPENEDRWLSRFPSLQSARDAGLLSLIAAPLISMDEVIGIIHLRSCSPHAFGQRELALAERIASQIAGAIANARLHARIERLADERENLAEIGRIISSSSDIDDVYSRFAEKVRSLIAFDRILIDEVNSDLESFTNAYAGGIEDRGWRKREVCPILGTLTGEVVRTRAPVLFHPRMREELEARLPRLAVAYDAGFRSFLSAPLMSNGKLIGVLHLGSTHPDAYKSDDVATVLRIGDQIAGAIANSRMYAEEKRTRQALERIESQTRAIITAIPDAMFQCNRTGDLVDHMVPDDVGGLRVPSDFTGKHATEGLPPEVARRFMESVEQVFQTGLMQSLEYQLAPAAAGGELRNFEARLVVSGPDKILVVVRDVTEHTLAEEELRLSNAALRATANGVVITDIAGVIKWVNPAFTDLTGYEASEAIGQNPCLLNSGEQDDAFYEELWDTILSGKVWHNEVVNRRKDGSLYVEEMTITPIRNEPGEITHLVAIKQDSTERRRLEQELAQSQRMEVIGQLAGGVAHDFNNLLSAIMGYCQMTILRVTEDEKSKRYLREIQTASERAAHLTQQLLAFSRRQVIAPKVLSLDEVVLGVEKMLGRLIGEHIELVTQLASDLGLVKADPMQLEQVLINLAVNARDAMPDGGRLTIQAENVTLTGREAGQVPEMTVGDYVLVTVADTGTGMPEDVRARVFEPFFTTKEVGKGTGLGLSTCYGIVAQSGGHIVVDSVVGEGTAFRIYLPAVDEPNAAPAPSDDLDILRPGNEVVLLVEDEPVVRELAAQVLQEQGYTVLEASDGVEALRKAQDHRGIDLLLTDVVMPFMSGTDLAEQFKELHPEAGVLLMSGYPEPLMNGRGFMDPDANLLQKPFTPPILTQKVREQLEGRL